MYMDLNDRQNVERIKLNVFWEKKTLGKLLGKSFTDGRQLNCCGKLV